MYLSNRVPTMHKNLGSVPIPSLKKMMKKIITCLPQNYQEKKDEENYHLFTTLLVMGSGRMELINETNSCNSQLYPEH